MTALDVIWILAVGWLLGMASALVLGAKARRAQVRRAYDEKNESVIAWAMGNHTEDVTTKQGSR